MGGLSALVRKMKKVIVLHRVHVLRGPIGEPPPLPDPRHQLSLHIATDPDDEVLRRSLPAKRLPYAKGCLSRGDRAYLAFAGGELAGWSFIALRSHRDPSTGLRIRLDPGDAYSYDSWVNSTFRDRGVFRFLFGNAYIDLRANGLASTMVGYVLGSNEAAFRASAPFGLSRVQEVSIVQVMGRWGAQVPFSERPRRGPVSRKG